MVTWEVAQGGFCLPSCQWKPVRSRQQQHVQALLPGWQSTADSLSHKMKESPDGSGLNCFWGYSFPSPLPTTHRKPNMSCGFGFFFFFQHPLEHKLSGTTGNFSLSFVSSETDLFKWYAGRTLLLKALVLVVFWALEAFLKIVEDGVIPENPHFPWSCLFLHFSKEIPLPHLLWRVLLISMWLKGEEVVWVLGSLPGRALGCLAGSPHGCHCSHPWDQYTSALLLLSQR